MNEDNPMSDESDDEDDNYDLGPIPDFKVAVEQRKERIAELEQGDAGDRRLAALLAKCRKNRRCDLVECAVCERRKLVARRGIPASVIKLIGWLNPMLHIGVRAIKVKGDRRALNPEKVIALAASMEEIGLQTPITVYEQKNKMILVSGRHRLAAAIQLSWDAIPCLVLRCNEIDVSLWQIAENFYRNELTVLERANSIEALRVLIRQKREREGGQVAPPGGSQPKDLGIKGSAKALGITREEVRRAKTISAISDKVKKRVRELGLDDNQRVLLEIAKLPPEGQAPAVEKVVQRKRAESVRPVDVSAADKKDVKKINVLQAKIRENASALVSQRKQLRLIQDKLAVQEELPPDASLTPLVPDDEVVFTSLVEAWARSPRKYL